MRVLGPGGYSIGHPRQCAAFSLMVEMSMVIFVMLLHRQQQCAHLTPPQTALIAVDKAAVPVALNKSKKGNATRSPSPFSFGMLSLPDLPARTRRD
jgi:hypothetical protein